MASIYTIDATSVINNIRYAESDKVKDKIEKALRKKKGIADDHVAAFMDAYDNYNFNSITINANQYITDHLKGKGLIDGTKNTKFELVKTAIIMGPQKIRLKHKFDLSVHLKGGNIQLHHTSCSGAKSVKIDVAPPS